MEAWATTDSPPPEHLPPFGLVTILPLVDVTQDNGATEFLPGSHVDLGASPPIPEPIPNPIPNPNPEGVRTLKKSNFCQP